MDQQAETVRLVAVTANPSLVIGLTFLGRDWDVNSSDDGSDLPEVPEGDVLVVDLGSTAAGMALLERLGAERPPAVIVGDGDADALERRDRLVGRPYTLQDLAAEVDAVLAGPRVGREVPGSVAADTSAADVGDGGGERSDDEAASSAATMSGRGSDPGMAADAPTTDEPSSAASGPGTIRSWADRVGRRSEPTQKPTLFSAGQAPNTAAPPPPPPGNGISASQTMDHPAPEPESAADDEANEPLFAKDDDGSVTNGPSEEEAGDAPLLDVATADEGDSAGGSHGVAASMSPTVGSDGAAASTPPRVLDLTDRGPVGPPIPPPPPVGPRILRASAPVAPTTLDGATTGPDEPRVKRSLFASRRVRPEGGAERAVRQRLAEVVSAGVELEQLCTDVPLLRSLPALARAVIAEVHAELEADVAVFFEHTDDGYVSLASIGLTPHERTLVVPLDQPMLAEVDRSGGGLLIDPIEAAHAAVAGIAGAHTASFMVASIAAGPGRFGLLAVGRNEPLKTGDLDRLLELALEAGPGVATAQLLRRLGGLLIAPSASAEPSMSRSYHRI